MQEYFDSLKAAQTKYRAAFSEKLLKCDGFVISVTKFDSNQGTEEYKSISQFLRDKRNIIHQKEFTAKECANILTALATQFQKPEHNRISDCHFPIHGISCYNGSILVYDTTFCWKCSNFSFLYPGPSRGSLETSDELKKAFIQLMPIPQSEIDRFNKKYPTPKKEDIDPAFRD